MTTKTKHTAGPWRSVWASFGTEVDIRGPKYQDRSSVQIATMADTDERDANARLIAAAPDLLAALQEIRVWCDANINGVPTEYGKMMERAEAAISKAVKP